jgi:rubrerythrin
MARFAAARKNNNDLLADCERLLLREADDPQMQNGAERSNLVIHPSEMAKSDWCPRSTYLRIKLARAGTLKPAAAHHFQLENIFEEGHECHRKWQARFRRMNRLRGRWFCEACRHRWEAISPPECPECGAPEGAVTYHEVGLKDTKHNISGSADGEVVALASDADDVLIEVKGIGEGTVRMEVPRVLMGHTHEVIDPRWGKQIKVLDHRGVWKDITKPFGPHLRQGLIYLRLRNDPEIKRICFIYEYKPTSAVKTFYVDRDDDEVQELWDTAADIMYALDEGGRAPTCIGRNEVCKECKPFEDQESEHDAGTKAPGRAREAESAGRGQTRKGRPLATDETPKRSSAPRRRPDRPGGWGFDPTPGPADPVGRLLGGSARSR